MFCFLNLFYCIVKEILGCPFDSSLVLAQLLRDVGVRRPRLLVLRVEPISGGVLVLLGEHLHKRSIFAGLRVRPCVEETAHLVSVLVDAANVLVRVV